MRVPVCAVIAVAALVAGLPAPATAQGVVFVVNTTSDAADGSPGDGICGIC